MHSTTLKPIPWDWGYSIDLAGNVFSEKVGRKMAVQANSHGYKYIGLKGANGRKNFLIHRLIMDLFGPPRPLGKDHVNHIDGNKQNNALINLEWCTHQENMAHSTHVLKNPKPPSPKGKRGSKSKLSKPVIAVSIFGGPDLFYESMRLADSDGFRIANVRASIRGDMKHYKGYVWKIL